MIPIGLVAGFLGSGKTTLLARWAERHRGRKLVYLVNDLGAANVDTAWLERQHELRGLDPGWQHLLPVSRHGVPARLARSSSATTPRKAPWKAS